MAGFFIGILIASAIALISNSYQSAKKEHEVTHKKEKDVSALRVYVYNKDTPIAHLINDEHSGVYPYRDFIKWYYCREDSDGFFLRWNLGGVHLKRKDIRTFEIRKQNKLD